MVYIYDASQAVHIVKVSQSLKYIKLASICFVLINYLCALFIYGAVRKDFDAGKSISRAIGRGRP
jgi:hypothetical protein